MSKKGILRKILTVATLILGIGVYLIIYSNYNNCAKIITKAIENKEIPGDFQGKRTAVYLITHINNSCRSCSKYEFLKKQPDVRIIFYVPRDYTDYDIENFREAFGVPPKNSVKRIGDGW
jgi:hypothetical protein